MAEIEKVTDAQHTNAERAAEVLASLPTQQARIVSLATVAYMSGFLDGMTARTA